MVGSCTSLYRAQWLTTLMRFISSFGDGIVIPILIVIISAAFFYRKDKIFAYILVSNCLVGEIAKFLLKNFFQIPRPAAFGCTVLTSYADKFSFPSGHTIFYTIFFGLVAYYCIKHSSILWAKIGFISSLLLVLLIGYSRIYLGAHWYLDVVGGYTVGGAILIIAISIYEYLSQQLSSGKNVHKNKFKAYDKEGYILKAGSIIRQDDKILLICRQSLRDYSFPKGHIERGEDAEAAMLREVKEETGLKVSILKNLPDILYAYPQGDGLVKVKMFLTEPIGGRLRLEHKGDRLEWLEFGNVENKLTYDNLKKYVRDNRSEIENV
jgi:membrane-associated phospholipid phosphatase/8-oxo-dGTP pyrophosphatase MutT (NUDIX family)